MINPIKPYEAAMPSFAADPPPLSLASPYPPVPVAPSPVADSEPKSSDGDTVLLQGIALQDPAAMGTLYDRHAAHLYRICYAVLRDQAEAEDVLQEVFVRVWERAASYNPLICPAAVWMTRIAHNLSIDWLRSRSRRIRLAETAVQVETDALAEALSRTSEPEQHAAQTEAYREITEAMNSLPVEQRQLIEFAYFRGLSQTELAVQFGIPLGTVKTRMRSALTHLRRQLQHLL